MIEGYIFLPRAVRPEVKKYIPRSEVDHLSIYTDKEVVLLYNFDLTPTFSIFFLQIIMEICNWLYCSTCFNFIFHTLLFSPELGLSSHHPDVQCFLCFFTSRCFCFISFQGLIFIFLFEDSNLYSLDKYILLILQEQPGFTSLSLIKPP